MIITAHDNYRQLVEWLNDKQKVLLVCDRSICFLNDLNKKFNEIKVPIVRFSDFGPNPLYESVVKGVNVFRTEGCDSIIAVGGGSAIDVAKCIKLYHNLFGEGSGGEWLNATIIPNNIPFMAVPTTAGTGSEATHYAVIYYKGRKQSISSFGIIPETVLLDPSTLKSLPLYQKKATMCDALCHAIESFWSVNSTEESKALSRRAIQDILKYMDGYLNNTDEGRYGMLLAANTAGKAINISQTTAGHAMCYKITSIFGTAHGHAAILCNRVLFSWMIENIDKCIDSRGEEYLRNTLDEIGVALGEDDSRSGAEKLRYLFDSLELAIPVVTETQLENLITSVNAERLKNHPISLHAKDIDLLYREALR